MCLKLIVTHRAVQVWVPAQGKRRSGAKKAGTVHKGAPGKRPAQGGHKGEEKDLGGMLAVAKGRRGNDIGKKASGAKRAVETKKRAGKAAPYKGVTIKNHRYCTRSELPVPVGA